MKPIVGTESCQIYHFGYVLSGRMKVVMDDGTVAEASAGDEPCVWLEPGPIATCHGGHTGRIESQGGASFRTRA